MWAQYTHPTCRVLTKTERHVEVDVFGDLSKEAWSGAHQLQDQGLGRLGHSHSFDGLHALRAVCALHASGS
mgnify:CR=1 FL=1